VVGSEAGIIRGNRSRMKKFGLERSRDISWFSMTYHGVAGSRLPHPNKKPTLVHFSSRASGHGGCTNALRDSNNCG
jgi:hypothetical protein